MVVTGQVGQHYRVRWQVANCAFAAVGGRTSFSVFGVIGMLRIVAQQILSQSSINQSINQSIDY